MRKHFVIAFVAAFVVLAFSPKVFSQAFVNGTVTQVAAYNGSKWVTITNPGGVVCNYVFPTTADANVFTALALTAQSSGKSVMVYTTTACTSNAWGAALGLYVVN